MANEIHLAILREGVEAWNRWRKGKEENPDLGCAYLRNANLSNANLSNANLVQAHLNDADLSDADLSGADLSLAVLKRTNLKNAKCIHTKMSFAYLTNAKLSGVCADSAYLVGTSFQGADLKGANLRDANLSFAKFDDANLSGVTLGGADFTDAKLCGTNFQDAIAASTKFADCDLSEAKGLDLVRHSSPSTVGIDTIYLSKGKIPASFLRGCGVPEGFITAMHSLVEAVDGIQFYSCFISYSSNDEGFARRLHGRMRDAHLRVWFAPEDIKGGAKLHEQIETAIRVYDKLLIVLSEASLQSEWVMTELRKARRAERQSGKRKLFPVRLVDFETLRDWECFDADSGKDLAVELREYFIPNFSNWKDHDRFEAAFARLLKDLRAEEQAK